MPTTPAHARVRTLLRRGAPYGEYGDDDTGLLGWFFCSDIEAQFEHLLGQWGDRDPIGLDVGAGGKDPLIGQHEGDATRFTIRRRRRPVGGTEAELPPLVLGGFSPFCRTLGTFYGWYPSCEALQRMAEHDGYDLRDEPGEDDQ